MKRILLIALLTFTVIHMNAQNLTSPERTVTQLFVATDQHDWATLEKCFASTVKLDYSSMTGAEAAKLSPQTIIESWKGILPGFEHTHHQLGNWLIEEKGNTAQVFCYGTATHYLQDEKGSLWTVVGTYDFELNKDSQNHWEVTSMKFNYKYQTGNTDLPKKAIDKVNQ